MIFTDWWWFFYAKFFYASIFLQINRNIIASRGTLISTLQRLCHQGAAIFWIFQSPGMSMAGCSRGLASELTGRRSSDFAAAYICSIRIRKQFRVIRRQQVLHIEAISFYFLSAELFAFFSSAFAKRRDGEMKAADENYISYLYYRKDQYSA